MSISQANTPLYVRDLMTVGVQTCTPTTTIEELAQLLLEGGMGELVVLDEGHGVGVIGPEQLLQAFTRGDRTKTMTAEDVMRPGVPTTPPDIPLEAAVQLMLDQGVCTLFLTHHAGGVEYPAASISARHILRLLAAKSPEELRDLGILAQRESPIQTFLKRRDEARRRNTSERQKRPGGGA
jgi:CBS domain-containing protein